MKTVRLILFWLAVIVLVAGAVGGSFWLKSRHQSDDDKAAEEAGGKKDLPKENIAQGVEIAPDALIRMGIECAPLEECQWSRTYSAYGQVVDPAPLVTLQNDLRSANAALEASQAEAVRTRALYQQGENAPLKAVEQAEAQAKADIIKLNSLRQRFGLEWNLSETDTASLTTDLASGKAAIVKAEMPEADGRPPEGAWAEVLPRIGSGKWLRATALRGAPDSAPLTRKPAWLLQLDNLPTRWPSNLAVDVRFHAPGETSTHGIRIPRQAVVWFDGSAWVFLRKADVPDKAGPEKDSPGEVKDAAKSDDKETESEKVVFIRRVVVTDCPMDGGFFAGNGFHVGEMVVTRGATELLSEEAKSQPEGD